MNFIIFICERKGRKPKHTKNSNIFLVSGKKSCKFVKNYRNQCTSETDKWLNFVHNVHNNNVYSYNHQVIHGLWKTRWEKIPANISEKFNNAFKPTTRNN